MPVLMQVLKSVTVVKQNLKEELRHGIAVCCHAELRYQAQFIGISWVFLSSLKGNVRLPVPYIYNMVNLKANKGILILATK